MVKSSVHTSSFFSLIFLVLFLVFPVNAVSGWPANARIAGINIDGRASITSQLNWASGLNANTVIIRQDTVGEYQWLSGRNGANTVALALLDSAIKSTHALGLKAVVYLSALRVVSPQADLNRDGAPDNGTLSLYGEYPEWVMRDRGNNAAVIYNQTGEGISVGDEVAWVSPANNQWKHKFLEQVKDVAALNPDGICVDNLRYPLSGIWRNSWAALDSAAIAVNSSIVPEVNEQGDFNNTGFLTWLKFRKELIENLAFKIDSVIKNESSNVKTMLILKDGISPMMSRYATDPVALSRLCDVLIHEYSPYGDAKTRTAWEWSLFNAGVKALSEMDGPYPTWFITYDDTSAVPTAIGQASGTNLESMLAVLAHNGGGIWVTGGEHKFGAASNYSALGGFLGFLKSQGSVLYDSLSFPPGINVYYSASSAFYDNGDKSGHQASFYGTLMALGHYHYSVTVTANLAGNTNPVVIFPAVVCLDTTEFNNFNTYAGGFGAGNAIVSGNTMNVCDPSLGKPDGSMDIFPYQASRVQDLSTPWLQSLTVDGLPQGGLKESKSPESDSLGMLLVAALNLEDNFGIIPFEGAGTVLIKPVIQGRDLYFLLLNLTGLGQGSRLHGTMPVQARLSSVGLPLIFNLPAVAELALSAVSYMDSAISLSRTHSPDLGVGSIITIDSSWLGPLGWVRVEDGAVPEHYRLGVDSEMDYINAGITNIMSIHQSGKNALILHVANSGMPVRVVVKYAGMDGKVTLLGTRELVYGANYLNFNINDIGQALSWSGFIIMEGSYSKSVFKVMLK